MEVAGSLITTVSLLTTTISLLNDIQDKPEDVRSLILELSSISGLLQSLRSIGEKRREEADWPKIWRSLLSSESPISELQFALAEFTRSFSSARDLSQTHRKLKWGLVGGSRRVEMQRLLVTATNARSVIAITLTVDQM